MTLIGIGATVLIGILSGVLSVLAGGGVTVVLPVLLALGLTADQANATSRFNLTIGAVIATIVLIRKKNVDWNETLPLLVASIVGAFIGACAGTLIHSNAMLTIIVLTSVLSMILVYLKPNRWLSTAHSQAVVPDCVGGLIYGFLCLYGGVVGYLDFSGNADFAIAIRTALMREGTAFVQAGGGVVADSNGPYEYTEAVNKAKAVLNAIAAAETLKSP